ncbi:hypothetical protein ACHAWC_005195 [Mediolabrus comicus]
MATSSGPSRSALRQQQQQQVWISGAGDSDVGDDDARQNNHHQAPPISGQIPSPSGGVHSYSYDTGDHLRHRPLITTPTRHTNHHQFTLDSVSLDDADVAAGAVRAKVQRCLSEPRSSTKREQLPRSTIAIASSSSITRGDTLRNRANGRTDILSYGGSEHDFLLLASSHSISEDNNDDETEYYKGKPQTIPLLPSKHSSLTIPSAVADAIISPSSTYSNINSNKFVVLGIDLSNNTRQSQFIISALGTFCFSLLYGYLQELITVELCNRKLGLFLAAAQFTGYTILSYFFRNLDKGVSPMKSGMSFSRRLRRLKNWGRLRDRSSQLSTDSSATVPIELYVGLSILRAIDLGMTNLAMQYVNYPCKTLMKSTRLVFTMLFGVIITKKRYNTADYGIVCLMVVGLAMFMHADSTSSAVFQPVGILMLTISLLCDGAISNMSEAIMNKYNVGQDEFIFRLYSIALFFVCIAAAANGDLRHGFAYLTVPGTLKEMNEGLTPTWSVHGKILTMVLFSTTGFLGSSCSAAITKSFGALTMSITSTARKATTIFLSFALFPNECTMEHICGIVLFITSLVTKSLRASKRGHHHQQQQYHEKVEHDNIHPDAVDAVNGSAISLTLKNRSIYSVHDAV